MLHLARWSLFRAALLWITPLTLENGWTNAPFSTNNAGVTVDAAGVVRFQGAIATAGSDAVPFTCRCIPADDGVYVQIDLCSATNGRLQIAPDGTVTVEAESNAFTNTQCFTSLDGTSFVRRSNDVTPLSLENSWTNGPFSTNHAGVTDVSGVVRFQGAIPTTGTNSEPFVLPPAFRPTVEVYVPVDMCGGTGGRLQVDPSGVYTLKRRAAPSRTRSASPRWTESLSCKAVDCPSPPLA